MMAGGANSVLGELRALIERVQLELKFPLLMGQSPESYLKKIDENAEILTWRAGGAVRGFIAFYCNDSDHGVAFVTMLIVDPAISGKGVGRALVNAAISFARAKSFRVMRLQVDSGNVPALRLYESCGFRLVAGDATHSTMELAL
ncbi:GNAT family N-acetyltransferase [Lysobacter olei]